LTLYIYLLNPLSISSISMHPFGGTPTCQKCGKAVYAAEQVMGPGRKLYHKPCLSCMSCAKRLDSFSLLEHDQLPYCKPCHVRNFGTRDLRQANLPHRDDTLSLSSPARPLTSTKNVVSQDQRSFTASPTPPRVASPVRDSPPPPRSNRRFNATTPTSPSSPREEEELEADEERDTFDLHTESGSSGFPSYNGTPANTGRHGLGGIPRTVQLSPTRNGSGLTRDDSDDDLTNVNSNSTPDPVIRFTRTNGRSKTGAEEVTKPIMQTATGTRYGAALGGSAGNVGVGANITGNSTGGSPRKWGGVTPSCPRCGKNVYFAEQVKAVGKTYHKGCLRCTECNTLLDSSRLRDHDGDPLCVRCYGKLHGPQGNGYALLGKAGG